MAGNWPEWRGPHRTGISHEEGFPTRWNHEENIVWKAPLRGLGIASPIVWDDQIFLASQVGEGPSGRGGRNAKKGRGGKEHDATKGPVHFLVQAFHRSDGRLLWEYRIKAKGELQGVHETNNLASSSCVTDGDLVYAWFGTGQLIALDRKGRVVWKRHIGREYSVFDIRWGHGSSPVIYQDLLILLCDHAPASYLLALDKRTGKELWKVDRGQGLRSYSTPLVVNTESRDELIVNSSQRIDAYNPSSGELLWSAGQAIRVPVSTPVYHDGVVYTSRGYRSGPYMAIRTGGKGNVSETHIAWRVASGAPYVSSLLYYQGLVYMATEQGIATCVEASTGSLVWRERLGGVFSASPVAADGKIYFLNEEGETIVLRAGRKPKVLERNKLNERCLASPALSSGQLFIRTDSHLICIGNQLPIRLARVRGQDTSSDGK